LPEVSLVAIMDADKEGFLRSERSLIQTMGRAARNNAGEVILYADEITDSMKRAIDETERRRKLQKDYNELHGIVPATIKKSRDEILAVTSFADSRSANNEKTARKDIEAVQKLEYSEQIMTLERIMKKAAKEMQFEKAAEIRDEISRLRKLVENK